MKKMAIIVILGIFLPSCSKYMIINTCEKYDDYGIKALSIIGADTTNKFVYTSGRYKIYFDADELIKSGLNPTIKYCDSLTKNFNDSKVNKFCKKYYAQKTYIKKELVNGKEINLNNFPHKQLTYRDSIGRYVSPGCTAANVDFAIALELCYISIIDTRTNKNLDSVKLVKVECYKGPTTIILKTTDNKNIIKYKYTFKF